MITLEISQIVYNKLCELKHLEVRFNVTFTRSSNSQGVRVSVELHAYNEKRSGLLIFYPENEKEFIEASTEDLYHRLFAKELLKFREP